MKHGVTFPAMKKPLFLLLPLLLSAVLHAEMATEVPVIEVKPAPDQDEVDVTFKFRNKGSKPVKILSLESSCSCLSSELDKAVYAAGEEGVGKAKFKIGSFVGRHEKLLTVHTDDSAQQEWDITFILDIPAVVDIQPKTLQWWIGDEPAEKSTKVIFTGAEPLKITNITATRENVDFTWKEVVAGREYLVTVKPHSTKEVTLGALKIETDSKIPKYQRQLAFFSIYNKPAEGEAKPEEVK